MISSKTVLSISVAILGGACGHVPRQEPPVPEPAGDDSFWMGNMRFLIYNSEASSFEVRTVLECQAMGVDHRITWSASRHKTRSDLYMMSYHWNGELLGSDAFSPDGTIGEEELGEDKAFKAVLARIEALSQPARITFDPGSVDRPYGNLGDSPGLPFRLGYGSKQVEQLKATLKQGGHVLIFIKDW